MSKPTIGWIGLGKMGAPMCDHLLAAGYPLRVFDLYRPAVDAAAAKGAQPCDSIAELAREAEIVISMVPDDPVLIAVSTEVIANLPSGTLFADMSTVSPEASAQVAELASAKGVSYVRAPVSGSTELATKGLLTVFSSGPAAGCEALEPIFATFAPTRFQVGATDQARYIKLAINHVVGSMAALMGEALTLGRKGDIDWDVMLEVMGASVIASPLVKYKLNTLKSRDFAPAFSAAQMRKDMGLVTSVGKRSGVHMPVADRVYEYFQNYAEYSPQNDFFGLVEEIESKSALGPLDRNMK